jgi:hypothetical protein
MVSLQKISIACYQTNGGKIMDQQAIATMRVVTVSRLPVLLLPTGER